jgi:RNA polymerase sigma-70 factor (ECF subfamily)
VILSPGSGVLWPVSASPALVDAVVRGDSRAREELVATWGPAVLRWCARLGGPRVDEDDAAHDVFEHVLERLHTLRDPAAFPAWLYQITRRVVSDHRRRAWVRRWVGDLLFEPAVPPRVDRDDDTRLVRELLDALPADLREVLVLCELEERDAPEVAALVGVPLGTVKSRLRRARERFAAEARARGLAPEGG